MKHLTVIISALLLCLTLSSCSSNHSDNVYFLHTAVFSKTDSGEFQISAVLEKLSGDDSKDSYFTAVESGKDITEAADKLSHKYRECYFATSEVYAFDDSLSHEDLKVIAKNVCDSNDYPSKSLACYIESSDTDSFCDAIKSEDDMKSLISGLSDKRVNVIHFLSRIYSGRMTELPTLTIRDGSLKRADDKTFNKE